MLLEVKNLDVFYDKLHAVAGISISVGEGEFVTMIGSNGAGKSSTLNAICGIQSCSGEIWFRGERIDHLGPAKRAAMGVIQVPEGRRVFPLLSVSENLRLGA